MDSTDVERFHHCKNSGWHRSGALLLYPWSVVQQHPYHLGTYRNADSQIYFRPSESTPFSQIRQVISSGLHTFYPSKYYRSEVFKRSSEKLSPQLICLLSILQLISEMSCNSFLTPAEFSSQSLFLILVPGESYLPRAYILVAKIEHRRRPYRHSGPLSSPSPRVEVTAVSIHSDCCSSDILICSQLESQGTF